MPPVPLDRGIGTGGVLHGQGDPGAVLEAVVSATTDVDLQAELLAGGLQVLAEHLVDVGDIASLDRGKHICLRDSQPFDGYCRAKELRIAASTPLTDGEMATYRRSPKTFFGVVNHVGGAEAPLDACDFVYGSYSQTPKQRLLQFIAGWPDLPALQILEQPEMAKRYYARMAEGIWARTVSVSRTGD
jgi:hypothetical protein